MQDRQRAVDAFAERCSRLGEALRLEGELSVSYRPRSRAMAAAELRAELAERVHQDLERGFTGHGPHRDELVLRLGGKELRAFGSQGQQRLGLLSLLLAEREALGEHRSSVPLLLLDDVMSELDRERRHALIELLLAGGQAVITTTDLEHVPGAERADVARIAIAHGRVLDEVGVR